MSAEPEERVDDAGAVGPAAGAGAAGLLPVPVAGEDVEPLFDDAGPAVVLFPLAAPAVPVDRADVVGCTGLWKRAEMDMANSYGRTVDQTSPAVT